MMLASFSNMETVHIAAYALLLDTIGMPESEFSAFLNYKEMRDKHDYMQKFGVETDADICARSRCSAPSPKGCSSSQSSRC
jgi:ribonucleoside-diphosphate reductase beta chain